MRIVTIGGYGFSQDRFLRAMEEAGVDTFIDVRQRRGMRGTRYAFLNSSRLQKVLASVGVKYVHARDLAPTTSVRNAQKQEDLASGTAKRVRTQLASSFVEEYRSEVLSKFDAPALYNALGGAQVVAVFCVEAHPAACHRSLAAEHLARIYGTDRPVEHLRA
jgi:uncharacterized protein (DUF488 family)